MNSYNINEWKLVQKVSFLIYAVDIWELLTQAWAFYYFKINLKYFKVLFNKWKLEPKKYFGVLKGGLKIFHFETWETRFLKETKIVQQVFGVLGLGFLFAFLFVFLCKVL